LLRKASCFAGLLDLRRGIGRNGGRGLVVVVASGGGESDEKEERESKERSHVESGWLLRV